MPQKPTILLTGFGPFLTVTENATTALIPAVAKAVAVQLPQVHCVAEILPTDWTKAPTRLDELMRQHAPVIVLQFGVSPRAKGFVIERRGRNERQPSIDASSCKPSNPRVVMGGPKFIDTSLPIKRLLTRLHELGLPAMRSHSAGKYVCNALLYHGLWAAECAAPAADPPMMGFVHLPVKIPATAAATKTLTMEQAIAGSVAIITTCVETLEARPLNAYDPMHKPDHQRKRG
jgi:pyroglutamyl-peptidase